MANEDIRAEAKRENVKLWEVAAFCGVAESTFCRHMRRELPGGQKAHILKAIERIAERKREQEVRK